jgi:uncharacterized GH25 family protein
MNSFIKACLLLALTALPAQAHFVWIIPDKQGDGRAAVRVVFSDNLAPDNPAFLKRIAGTELSYRAADGRTSTLKMTQAGDAYQVALPNEQPAVIGGVCRYGVTQRGSPEPFLLIYHPKALVPFAAQAPKSEQWDRLDLEILPVSNGQKPSFQVLWRQKPLSGAEVVVLEPGNAKGLTLKTDEQGKVHTDKAAPGLYGVRVRHDEAREGDLEGKHYQSVRHYATLVCRLGRNGEPTTGDPAGERRRR